MIKAELVIFLHQICKKHYEILVGQKVMSSAYQACEEIWLEKMLNKKELAVIKPGLKEG